MHRCKMTLFSNCPWQSCHWLVLVAFLAAGFYPRTSLSFETTQAQFFFWFQDRIHEKWVLERHEEYHMLKCVRSCQNRPGCKGLALGPLQDSRRNFTRACYLLANVDEEDFQKDYDCTDFGTQVYLNYERPRTTTTTEVPTTTTTTESTTSTTTEATTTSTTETTTPSTTEAATTSTTTVELSTTQQTSTESETTTTAQPTTTEEQPSDSTTEKLTTGISTTDAITTTEKPSTTTIVDTTTTTEKTTTTVATTTTTEASEAPDEQNFDKCTAEPTKAACQGPKKQMVPVGIKSTTALFSSVVLELECENMFMADVFKDETNIKPFKPFEGKIGCDEETEVFSGLEMCFQLEVKYLAPYCTPLQDGYRIDRENMKVGQNSVDDPKKAICPDETVPLGLRLEQESDGTVISYLDCAKIVKEGGSGGL